MSEITITLREIIASHAQWINGAGGKRADLAGADLAGANLRGANLWGANLWEANLWGADLRGANESFSVRPVDGDHSAGPHCDRLSAAYRRGMARFR